MESQTTTQSLSDQDVAEKVGREIADRCELIIQTEVFYHATDKMNRGTLSKDIRFVAAREMMKAVLSGLDDKQREEVASSVYVALLGGN